ncbi:MAG: transposase [Armatimonadota bacterium]|nr:transposase [Armatimonadota bacterium]
MLHRERRQRRSIRLPGYDYSQPGAYFVTICTHERLCLFGEVVNGQMHLSPFGQVVYEEWYRSAQMRREIVLNPDEMVIMPNHLHGIVWIVETATVGADGCPPIDRRPPHGGAHVRAPLQRRPRSLSSFIAGFKSATTARINAVRATPGEPLWQRNYYEHIIRDEARLNRIREYILLNPLRWHLDYENAERTGEDELWNALW